ncbi:MAG TPA: Ig-like domain-containing protein, partial [Elusimicrobiota bacterium]|nr:Ig-like domain-containing protein [Elusimicrobiota bacterium]
SGVSSNGTLLPNSALVFGGSGANRTVVLTPALNQNGTTTLTLTVTDGGGLTAQTAFKLTVTAVNDPPVALAQSLGVPSNTPKLIHLGGTDVDGDTLSYAYAQPSHGSVTGTAPLVTYTPNNGYVGFDTFTFTASDGLLPSPSASIVLQLDDTPPAVSITQPAEGATVMYTAALSAAATDNQSVDRVLFYADGVAIATATSETSAFTAGWDTSSAANGSHVLTARAYDNAGNTALSSAVTVTVDNPALAQLAVAPGSLGFYGVEGGPVPPVSPLTLSTASAGGSPSWTISVSTPWLSVSPLSGRGPNTVSVGVSPVGLSTGVFSEPGKGELVTLGAGPAN